MAGIPMFTKGGPGGPGRKSLFSIDIGQSIVESVRAMLTINYAAELHRIPRATVHSWIEKGREDSAAGIDSDLSRFSDSIRQARAEFIHKSIEKLSAGTANWQASAWLLERCCAEEFGKDAEMYKQLLEDYRSLLHSLSDKNKGLSDGRKEKELD